MISKSLDAIAVADLKALVDSGAPESRRLEFKRELQVSTRDQRVDFLAAVSSFANAAGGDIVYGIDAPSGTAIALPGVPLVDPDATVRLLDQVIQNGLQPRLPGVSIRPLPLGEGRFALVVRVRPSWVKPHRVTHDGHDKFYARSSAGRRALDVGELRTAFLQSETLTERIRDFRAARLAAIVAGETPVRLNAGAKLVLHVVPVTTFAADQRLAVSEHVETLRGVQPLGGGGWDYRINLDGAVTFDRPAQAETYTQIFRAGAAEALEVFVPRDGRRVIPSVAYEQHVMRGVPDYVRLLHQVGAGFPMFVFLALLDLRGYSFALHPSLRGGHEVDREAIVLPEVVIEDP